MTATWAYGVTTLPDRLALHLPATLASLAKAGFDSPRLFVDRAEKKDNRWDHFGLETTLRCPRIRAWGNWILGLSELWIRNPHADYYVMFQDDLLSCGGLREYLGRCEKPPGKWYLNLATMIRNEHVIAPALGQDYSSVRKGWHEGELLIDGEIYHGKVVQGGRGAMGLVFTAEGVEALLSHSDTWSKPKSINHGHRHIDGCVVEVMNKLGFREWVHNPSLLQHTGNKTTIAGEGESPAIYPPARTWMGEGWSALSLLSEK